MLAISDDEQPSYRAKSWLPKGLRRVCLISRGGDFAAAFQTMSGIAKSDFTVGDLLDEVFRFDAAEVAQLQRRAIQSDAGRAIDSAVGR